MRSSILITVAVLLGTATASISQAIQSNWTLVWNDEFNGNALNTTKWSIVN